MDSPARSPPFSDYFGSPPESFRFYDQQPEIGRGAYGSVHPGELNGRPVAVKRIHTLLLEAYSRDEYIVKSFEAECRRMQSLNHPRLVTFLGAYKDAGGPFLVMERMLQDLRHFLDQNRGKLTLQNQVQLCLDIATGLHYLHSQDTPLVHRDLNDKNILIDKDGRASIADLGQSRLKKKPWEYFATQAPGAMVFMPPEALSKTPHYNEMMDIFSFGVLMLEIATQREPNPGLQGIARDQEEDRRKEDLDCLPEGHPLKQLILDCLQNDPHKRPHIEKLCHELQQLAKPAELFRLAKDSFQSIVSQLQASLCNATTLANTASSSTSELLAAVDSRVAAAKRVADCSEMKVVFFGRTSNGKSTLINALLKCQVLPTGDGSVTNCFCLIKGQSRTTEGGYVKLEDSDEEHPVENALKLASYFVEERKLDPDSNLRIYWSTVQCPLLIGDIVLVDCPGLNARKDTDAKVIQHCFDADVFVYVANGKSTFDTGEQELLEKVTQNVSKPSSTFILFNQWDLVKKDGADRVKQQHLKKVDEILVQQLQVYTAKMAQNRTFFLSAEEACKVQLPASPDEQLAVSSHQQEFERFQRMMQEILSGSAIQTKFGRHWESCTQLGEELKDIMEQLKQWCQMKLEEQGTVLSSESEHLAQIIDAEQTIQQTSRETVLDAVEEVDQMFDEFYVGTITSVQEAGESFFERVFRQEFAGYQIELLLLLDGARNELIRSFDRKRKTLARNTISKLQVAYKRLSIITEDVQYGLDSLTLELTTYTEMMNDYSPEPIIETVLAPELCILDAGQRIAQCWHSRTDEKLEPEVQLPWLVRRVDREKRKMIITELKCRLEPVRRVLKDQYKNNFQRLLQSVETDLNAALADKKKVLTEHTEGLQQRIEELKKWKLQAGSVQSMLQQEVEPQLDHFRDVYLQPKEL